MNVPSEFLCHPTVFAIGDTYQIITPVKSEMLFWVKIGDKKYFDHSNGIMRSATRVHKVVVPMTALDSVGEYTVCYKNMLDRKPYFPESEDTAEFTYKFKPVVKGSPIKLYHVADSHGRAYDAIEAAKTAFGEDTDLLVLNGDISDHSSSVENISMIYRIASGITEGAKPCVYARGNHDMRGAFAEHLAEYTPTTHGDGLTYFTFRLGDLWGLVLDCAEDKLDTDKEYGGTVCCHSYREAETEFLKQIADSKEFEGAKYKAVICHAPFTYRDKGSNGIFEIENDIYAEWVRILNENIKPDLMLAGHTHICAISQPDGEMDDYGQSFPVVIGARPQAINGESGFTGTAFVFDGELINTEFTDSSGNKKPCALINIKRGLFYEKAYFSYSCTFPFMPWSYGLHR